MEESVGNRSLDTARLVALAEGQNGVFAVWQAVAVGVSAQVVQRRARTGLPHRRHHGVCAVGHTKLTLRGLWSAAVQVDGYGHHRSRSSFDADRRKDLRLSLAGFRVVRVIYERIVRDAQELIIELAGLIGSAAA
ncbi:MAG: hypothetical protein ABI323_03640 [Solirubrobacteraceae bacterium]